MSKKLLAHSEFDGMELPPMEAPTPTAQTIYHVGVSGGKDSGAALIWLVKESGIPADKIIATFCDISNDHPWTLDHVKRLSETVHPIETIYPHLGFFDLALDRRRFPSTKVRFCTEELKIWPTAEHLQKLRFQGWRPISVSGTRADESEERKTLNEWDFSGTLLCYQWRPILRWNLEDVIAIHARHSIPMNPMYEAGAQRVGCWPCIMSRKDEIRRIALVNPERIDAIRELEQRFHRTYGRYSSFFAADKVPPRFRSMPFTCADGRKVMVATIDDVVRWSMTGDRARGSWTDEPAKEPQGCQSGFCE